MASSSSAGRADGQAGRARSFEQRVDVVLVLADQLDQPLHLGQRLPAGLGDLREAARGRALTQPARAGLHDHDRQVMRDDVVQLARDPRLLVADGELGLRRNCSASSSRVRSLS